jgi:hypothetical protein
LLRNLVSVRHRERDAIRERWETQATKRLTARSSATPDIGSPANEQHVELDPGKQAILREIPNPQRCGTPPRVIADRLNRPRPSDPRWFAFTT